MRDEQRTMLGLIAAGRLTAADALRLEAAWSARRDRAFDQAMEWLGAVALCGLACTAEWLQNSGGGVLHGALALIHQVAGGMR